MNLVSNTSISIHDISASARVTVFICVMVHFSVLIADFDGEIILFSLPFST